jgi:glycolate oxidase FAD binding subunit
VTFKVLPTPETEATLVLSGRDDRQAVTLLSAALGTPFEITGAAHLPRDGSEPARTAIRIEGFAASVDVRAKRLSSTSGAFAGATTLDKAASQALWLSVRDLGALGAPADAPVWRLSLKPGDAPVAVEAIRRAFDCRVLYDWGGGLVWLAGGTGADAGAETVRAAIAPLGGYATLVRAPADMRNTVDVFQPQPAPIMALTRKLKATFDPAGVLNPGRMYAGI